MAQSKIVTEGTLVDVKFIKLVINENFQSEHEKNFSTIILDNGKSFPVSFAGGKKLQAEKGTKLRITQEDGCITIESI